MFFALYLLSMHIAVSLGNTFDQVLKEIDQFDEYSDDLTKLNECGNQYKNLKNGHIKELVEDDVWFTYFFAQNIDICSRLELIWDDINTELQDNLYTIIEEQEYDNYESYNVDINLISEIKTYFGIHEYLSDDEVKTDLAFYALSWLTSRKRIFSSVSDFCHNQEDERINTITDQLLGITDECVLNMDDENGSDNYDNNDRRLLQIFGDNNRTRDNRTCEERIAERVGRELALQLTLNIGAVVQFEFGIGLFLTVGPIVDVSIYRTMGVGILLPFEVTLQINIFRFNFPFTGRDLLNAKGKWTLGASATIGGGFSWIRNSNRKTIATSINFGVGIGLSLVDYVWFIDGQTTEIKTLVNLDICARLRNISIDINPFEETEAPTPPPGSPTASPTIKPEVGTDIDLFNDNNQDLWTIINGNWSDFERQGFGSEISITDNGNNNNEINTIWIGTQFPETLAWFDYTVTAELEITDSIINGDDSVGFIFGVQENINEAYYYGIYLNSVIFGIFDSNGNFNLIEERSGFDQIDPDNRNPSVELEAVFKAGDITLKFEGVPTLSHDGNELLVGSVGLRTIGKSGKYSSFEISF